MLMVPRQQSRVHAGGHPPRLAEGYTCGCIAVAKSLQVNC